MRPGEDEECNYPHPPKRAFQAVPPSPSKSIRDGFVMGAKIGALFGGSLAWLGVYLESLRMAGRPRPSSFFR